MDWKEFGSSLVGSLAWPLAAVAIVALLRRRLGELLAGPLRRLKAGPSGVELEYWDRLAQDVRRHEGTLVVLEESAADSPPLPAVERAASVRAELEQLARERPREAVLEAHRRVERELRKVVEAKVPLAADAPDAVTLTGLGAAHKMIGPKTLQALEGLNVMRNLAVHSRADELTPGRAMEYLDLADAVIYTLRTGP